jgi:hypothetical protein
MLNSGVCEAAPGYYLNISNIPVKCNLVGCYICASATVCSTCSSASNFIMDNSTQTCVCDNTQHFVLLASASACICDSGFYLTSNGTCDTIPLCPANNSGCANCSLTPTCSCLQCDSSNFFQTATFDSSYCTCMDSYYFDGFSCNLCNATLTNACITCISSTLCLSCKSNFTLFEGSCACLP